MVRMKVKEMKYKNRPNCRGVLPRAQESGWPLDYELGRVSNQVKHKSPREDLLHAFGVQSRPKLRE